MFLGIIKGNMTHKQKTIITIAFLGSLVLAFILGRLSTISKPQGNSEIKIITSQDLKQEKQSGENYQPDIQIRASSQGTKYYFPWCKSTFNEENTIYFSSVSEAIEKGYEQASGCLLEPTN